MPEPWPQVQEMLRVQGPLLRLALMPLEQAQRFQQRAPPRKAWVLMMLQALAVFAVLPPAQQAPRAASKAQLKPQV